MVKLINLVNNLGWKVVISFVFPVYWSQDKNFKNNGYDILTIFKSNSSYNKATYWNNV
jgi:hypothetical protein